MADTNAAKAELAKSQGNEAFREQQFGKAVAFFTEAISLDEKNEVYYSNRSMAYLKQGDHPAALKDAETCITLKPGWGKGYSRKGACFLMMQEAGKAIEAYKAGLVVEPESKVLIDALASAEKVLAGGSKTKKKKKKKKKGGVDAEVAVAADDATAATTPSYVIGIDLGTTYSCVGVWIDNKVKIIEDKNGEKTIPSYVCFDPETGERFTGHAARNQSTRLPKNVVYDVKRILGQRFKDNGVTTDIDQMQYEVVKGEDGKPMIQVVVKGETIEFAPEEISAMVLSHCKQIAENYLNVPVTRAVVTVPAYFNDAQRSATKAAGRIAGLDVLRIINEPTAAALSYGLDNAVKSRKPFNVLIFDLGGGTFDVSILTIEGGLFTVKATGGDTRLGGEDFDNNLMGHIIKEVRKQFPNAKDPREFPRTMQRLRKATEKCKRELSSVAKTEVRLDALMDIGNFVCTVSRAKFEGLNQARFGNCMDTVAHVLKDGKMKPADIHEIVLVGGSTRIPKLQEMLMEMFGGKTLSKSLNPDEAVAYGAAIQGAILSGTRNSKTESLLLMDITPLSLGIEIEGGTLSVLIPRNTPIPCIKTQTYTTERDNQTEDTVPVYEGERVKASENNLLGKFHLTGIQKAKKGVPQLAVTFSIDSNGILEVTAEDQKTKASTKITIEGQTRATTDQIDNMVAEAAKYKKQDEERLRAVEAKNGLEEAIYECLDIAKSMEDMKLAAILTDAAEKEQAWLDSSVAAAAKTSEVALRRRALERRLESQRS